VLLESPRPVVRPRPGSVAALGPLRLAAAAAAIALAVLARGDVFALALLLVIVARRPASTAAVLLVGASVLVRWGSTSLDALAGAQAVFGPAAVVGSTMESLAAVCAAAAVVLATPATPWPRWLRPPPVALLVAAPFGATGALIAAGPAPGGALVARIAATAAGLLFALLVTRFGTRAIVRRAADGTCAGLGIAALTLATIG
jgi:hypothetical protein